MKIHFDTAPKTGLHWFEKSSENCQSLSSRGSQYCFRRASKIFGWGYWIAGLASYELSYALEPKLSYLADSIRSLPLIQFGVFDGPSSLNLENSYYSISSFDSDWDETQYKEAFDQVLAYIEAGDIYQTNLTFSLFSQFRR